MVNVVGETLRTGCSVAELTVSVTVTVAGDPCAPAAAIVMWPMYVPETNPLTLGDICRVWGAVPLVGRTTSHDMSLEAVKLRVPVPTFDTETEAGAGFEPPCVAVNESVAGETERAGWEP